MTLESKVSKLTNIYERFLFLGCPFYDKERRKLIKECEKLKLDVNVKNAMCHPELHLTTERFFVALSTKNV